MDSSGSIDALSKKHINHFVMDIGGRGGGGGGGVVMVTVGKD